MPQTVEALKDSKTWQALTFWLTKAVLSVTKRHDYALASIGCHEKAKEIRGFLLQMADEKLEMVLSLPE